MDESGVEALLREAQKLSRRQHLWHACRRSQAHAPEDIKRITDLCNRKALNAVNTTGKAISEENLRLSRNRVLKRKLKTIFQFAIGAMSKSAPEEVKAQLEACNKGEVKAAEAMGKTTLAKSEFDKLRRSSAEMVVKDVDLCIKTEINQAETDQLLLSLARIGRKLSSRKC